MKRNLILMILVFCACLTAKTTDVSAARNVAKNLAFERLKFKRNHPIKQEGILSEEGIEVIYYFNFEPEGWALISAQDNVYPILAYGDDGVFHYEDVNPAAKMFIDSYKKQIKWALDNNQNRRAETIQYWNDICLIETCNFEWRKL